MKQFLSIEKFKELTTLFILEIFMSALLYMLIKVNWQVFQKHFATQLFDWRAFTIVILVWALSSLADKERYFNLATLIGTGYFFYICFWFLLNILNI